jgi:hypothetical protein
MSRSSEHCKFRRVTLRRCTRRNNCRKECWKIETGSKRRSRLLLNLAPLLLPPRRSRLRSDLAALLGSKSSGPRVATLQSAFACVFFAWIGLRILDFPRRDPHDMDRVADYVGRAFLTFGASRHEGASPNRTESLNSIFCAIEGALATHLPPSEYDGCILQSHRQAVCEACGEVQIDRLGFGTCHHDRAGPGRPLVGCQVC